MYRREKAPDNFNYISDYKDFYDQKQIEIFSDSPECKNKKKFRKPKFLKIIFSIIFLILGVLIFSIFLSILDKTSKTSEFKEYDDFIWPLVLQDPPEFNEKNSLSFDLKLRSAIWDASFKLKNDEDLFNDKGELIISEEEVQNSAKKLFGNKIDLHDFKKSEQDFFSFDNENNIFLVSAISADERPVPHTISAKTLKDKIFLEVEYFVPEKESDKPEKTMKYFLKKDNLNNKYITEVKNINNL